MQNICVFLFFACGQDWFTTRKPFVSKAKYSTRRHSDVMSLREFKIIILRSCGEMIYIWWFIYSLALEMALSSTRSSDSTCSACSRSKFPLIQLNVSTSTWCARYRRSWFPKGPINFGNALTFPLAPPRGWYFWFGVKYLDKYGMD